jgi:hypothetical protein
LSLIFESHDQAETVRQFTDMNSQVLPNCFVVGAARCGTTTIYRYLREHPHAYVPGARKELGWFCDVDGRVDDFAVYCRLFEPGKGKALRVDVSPPYLYSENAATLIRKTCGDDVKVVVFIRNPIEAARSLWQFQISRGHETLDFLSAIEAEEGRKKNPMGLSGWRANYYYIDRYRYAPQIKRFIDVFGKEHVRVFVFEKFFGTENGWWELCDFLRVDGRLLPFPLGTRHNQSGRSRIAILARTLANPPTLLRLSARALVPDAMRWKIASAVEEWNVLPQPQKLSAQQRTTVRQLFANDVAETSRLIGADLSADWR